jgi:hypothetical protein
VWFKDSLQFSARVIDDIADTALVMSACELEKQIRRKYPRGRVTPQG